jgi:hypothetical protein
MIDQQLSNSGTHINAQELQQRSLQQLQEHQLPQNNDDVLMVRHADHWMAQAHERASFGIRAKYVSCLPIVTWAKVLLPYRLPMA